jgi:uncharacterized phage protein (TIGR02220 family)
MRGVEMAISVMTTVWEASKLGGTELLLLLGIADFANHDGVAYPSVGTLAKKIRMSERNTHYLLKKLEESGELEVKRNAGPRGCNLFRVKTLQGAEIAGVQPIAGRGATGSAKGEQPTAPEPSLNRQEPLSKAAAEVLAHLNEKTERNYKPVLANLSLIAARLKEGATPEECRRVIDAKATEWGSSEKMSKFLRPATLFNATKFAQYVGELASGTRETGGEQWE